MNVIKKNDDKAKKRKRKNNVSKRQKVHDEIGVSENEFVEKLELYVEVDKSKKIKKKNTVSVDENSSYWNIQNFMNQLWCYDNIVILKLKLHLTINEFVNNKMTYFDRYFFYIQGI
jgi:hypothetical protein